MTDAEARRAWLRHERERRAYEKQWALEWYKYYLLQGKIIIRDIDMPDPTFMAFSTQQIETIYTAMYLNVGREFARGSFTSIPGSSAVSVDDLLLWEREMRNYALTYGGDSIRSISATGKDLAKKIIRNATAQAIEDGISPFELGKYIEAAIQDEWKLAGKFNAERIARTELATASNYGAFVGAQSTGIEMVKVWNTVLDGRERQAHQDAYGQSVKMNQPFIVGGEVLNVPGDKTGSAGNTINCRCSVLYKPKKSFLN